MNILQKLNKVFCRRKEIHNKNKFEFTIKLIMGSHLKSYANNCVLKRIFSCDAFLE